MYGEARKDKKRAESDKKLLETFIESNKNRVTEIFNEKIKAQNELDEIFHKIDKPKAVKAYV